MRRAACTRAVTGAAFPVLAQNMRRCLCMWLVSLLSSPLSRLLSFHVPSFPVTLVTQLLSCALIPSLTLTQAAHRLCIHSHSLPTGSEAAGALHHGIGEAGTPHNRCVERAWSKCIMYFGGGAVRHACLYGLLHFMLQSLPGGAGMYAWIVAVCLMWSLCEGRGWMRPTASIHVCLPL